MTESVRYQRIPFLTMFDDTSAFRDTYGGVGERVALESYLLKPDRPSKTALTNSSVIKASDPPCPPFACSRKLGGNWPVWSSTCHGWSLPPACETSASVPKRGSRNTISVPQYSARSAISPFPPK